MARRGVSVAFQIKDVYLPGPLEILSGLGEGERLMGVLSDITQAGAQAESYGVVELSDRTKVIVPLQRLQLVEMAGSFSAEERLEEEEDAN